MVEQGSYLTDGQRLVEVISVEATYVLISDCSEPMDDPVLGRLPVEMGAICGWREVTPSDRVVTVPETRKEAA
jgi:hypothetical protein